MPLRSGPLAPRVGVCSVSSALEVGADRAPQAAQDLVALLEKNGCAVVPLGPISNADEAVAAGRNLAISRVDAAALAVASWFEDYLVLDLLEECRVPLLLWSLPGMETGALCGTQQLTSYLKQLGERYHCVHGPMGAEEYAYHALAFLHAAALKNTLRRARIGLAGHRVAGMTEVAVNEIALKKAIGPRVVPIDLPQLLANTEEIPEGRARAAWHQVIQRVSRCNVSEEVGLDAMRVHAAVCKVVEKHGLTALTIGCYPHLMGRVCLVASLLADEGIPLGCEGDVNTAIGQLMLTLLTGGPTHNTDWLDPLEDGTIVFTHCGSGSFSLAERSEQISLEPVRLMSQGVCALFPAKPGPVTLVNLMPVGEGYQCALLEGEAISTDMVFPGNPVRVRFVEPVSVLLQWIHDAGVGHHWAIGYGHVGAEIRAWAYLAGETLRLIEPNA